MRRWVIAPLLILTVVAGCATDTQPRSSRSFGGWVPEPSADLVAYTDCLRSHEVPVVDVVGAFALVDAGARARLDAAEEPCRDKAQTYRKTIASNASRQIENESAYIFIHQVRNCMIRVHQIDIPSDRILLVLGEPGPTANQFAGCVNEIRAHPTPTI
jgi:hypothetical protein